jgi:hypothetical protein
MHPKSVNVNDVRLYASENPAELGRVTEGPRTGDSAGRHGHGTPSIGVGVGMRVAEADHAHHDSFGMERRAEAGQRPEDATRLTRY